MKSLNFHLLPSIFLVISLTGSTRAIDPPELTPSLPPGVTSPCRTPTGCPVPSNLTTPPNGGGGGRGGGGTTDFVCNSSLICRNLSAAIEINREYNGVASDVTIRCCLQNVFSTTTTKCSSFVPFAMPRTYCSHPWNRRTCETMCSLRDIQRLIPPNCVEPKNTLCRMQLTSSQPYDEVSETLQLQGLTNFVDMLRPEEVVEGISGTLTSIEEREGMLTDENAQDIFTTLDEVFDDNYRPMWEGSGERGSQRVFRELNLVADQIGRDFMRGRRNSSFSHKGRNLVVGAQRLRLMGQRRRGKKFRFPTDDFLENSTVASKASMNLPHDALCSESDDNCSVVVVVSIIDNFADYLQEAIQNITNTSINDIKSPDAVLMSAVIYDSEYYLKGLKDSPVEFYFVPKTQMVSNNTEMNYTGVFLNSTSTDLQWSSEGLESELLPNGTIKVLSTHLTSFTVLLSVNGVDDFSEGEVKALSIVTYVGCAISIVCLILTIAVLLILRKKLNKGVLLYIHLNLSIALLLALALFVGGIEPATVNEVLCTVVAAVLQYLFLCVFCWMLCEAIMLYLLLVKVFGNLTKRWYFLLLLLLGWGLPVPIVAISAGVLHEDYRTPQYCWINASISKPAIWTFIVPVVLIILINTFILVLTVVTIVRGRKLGGAEHNLSKFELVKTAVKASVVLLPLLGVTWVFGFFAVGSRFAVFAWLFTVFNSLQGLFIFIFHVLRNDVFLKSVKSCFNRCLFKKGHFAGESSTDYSSKVATKAHQNSSIGTENGVTNPVFDNEENRT